MIGLSEDVFMAKSSSPRSLEDPRRELVRTKS